MGSGSSPRSVAEAIANAHEWFEHNSGWAPPDEGTLDEWRAEGVCRAPDDCLVATRGWCEHGLASWCSILEALEASEGVSPQRRQRWPLR